MGRKTKMIRFRYDCHRRSKIWTSSHVRSRDCRAPCRWQRNVVSGRWLASQCEGDEVIRWHPSAPHVLSSDPSDPKIEWWPVTMVWIPMALHSSILRPWVSSQPKLKRIPGAKSWPRGWVNTYGTCFWTMDWWGNYRELNWMNIQNYQQLFGFHCQRFGSFRPSHHPIPNHRKA